MTDEFMTAMTHLTSITFVLLENETSPVNFNASCL